MKKNMITLIAGVIMSLLVFSESIAMERNWQWIESDDEVGYFIDAENAYNHKAIGQIVDYSDVWVKCAYTREGAESEIDIYGLNNVSTDVLKEGYGLYKLRLKYLTGEIQFIYIGFYDKNGKLLEESFSNDTNIYRDSYMESIMYYMTSKITKGNEFSIYKNPSIPKSYWWEMKNKYGGITKFYVPIYSIKNFGKKYEFVLQRIDYRNDKSIQDDNVYYISYEGGEYYYITGADVQNGYSHRMIKLKEPEKNEIVPSSYIERAIEFVEEYCKNEDNRKFIKRNSIKGLIPR